MKLAQAAQPAQLHTEQLQLLTGQLISAVFEGGLIHGISGPSGTGKSLMLRALADLDPCAGRITLNGTERHAQPAPLWRSRVMLVPTESRWWWGTADQHMSSRNAPCIAAAAQSIGLTKERMQADVEQLSSGEKARAALLRALSRDPQVLLLDEPTAALDSRSVQAVEQVVRQWMTPNRIVLWVSHEAQQLQRLDARRWTLDSARLHRA